ncbi:hypothetical protein BFS06_14125 [Clostridium perfringens]|uniref:Uncharacterized protein n=1 Tax=Clostridium perfringens TaxID=1502 RepID=A0A140GRI9_CLOPF|nr:hypothetical protein [Clostridium perfringens]AMN31148.1 hypothetical protein JFP838_pA0232 [Clostridium perfringens]TBX14344.1 hypothetical protein BFS06_14125 [Clostridium perfringens]
MEKKIIEEEILNEEVIENPIDKLYVIFEDLNNNGKVTFKEVTITKQTNKKIFIECPGVDRKLVLKTDFNKVLERYIFGTDKEEMKRVWNEYQEYNMLYLKAQLKRIKSLIVA